VRTSFSTQPGVAFVFDSMKVMFDLPVEGRQVICRPTPAFRRLARSLGGNIDPIWMTLKTADAGNYGPNSFSCAVMLLLITRVKIART
jgi:hypothetical protein